MLQIIRSNQFKKDYKKAIKQGKDIELLKEVITKLLNKEKLDKKYNDHKLGGKLKGCRDCHIESDFVLIYQTTDEVLKLIRIGPHSELF